MKGIHIIAELYDCEPTLAALHRATALATLCREACTTHGLEVVGECFHQFGEDAGATGAVVLAESHLAIHTWPELKVVTLDLYVCNFSRDNQARAEAVFATLSKAFNAARVVRQVLQRGALIETPR